MRRSRKAVADRVWEEMGREVPRQAVAAHLAMMADRYIASTLPERIAAHLRLVERLEGEPVTTELFHHPDLGSSDLVVVTRDVPGLFSLIPHRLGAAGPPA